MWWLKFTFFSFLSGEATVEVEGGESGTVTEQRSEAEPMDVFYPTEQWQTVKEGIQTYSSTGLDKHTFRG